MIYALKCQVVLSSEATEFSCFLLQEASLFFTDMCLFLQKTRKWFCIWIAKIPCGNCTFSGSHKNGVTWVCFPIWLPAGSSHSVLTSSLITVILNTFTSIRKNSGWMRSLLLPNVHGQKESAFMFYVRMPQHKDVYKTIEMLQRAHIFKVNCS